MAEREEQKKKREGQGRIKNLLLVEIGRIRKVEERGVKKLVGKMGGEEGGTEEREVKVVTKV